MKASIGMCPNAYVLEPSADEMRSMIDLAADRIIAHIASLPEQPATQVEEGPAVARALLEPLPATGTSFPELLDLLFDRAVPTSFNTAGPGYLAYIPGGGVFPSAVADLIANAVNRYVGVWAAAPGLVQLETNVIRWFCDIVGLPDGAGGILTTGGSLANFTALVTARRERLGEDFLSGTIYASQEVHHSLQKAAVLAGFPERNVREIPVNDRFQVRPDLLAQRMREDREEGRHPFMIVGSAGTANTGAIDDLERLAGIAREEDVWFHVDAAYGGFFMLTERGRAVMGGIERADSVVMDPHKGLFLPYGLGSLLVRDPETLRRAHTTFADYMPEMQGDRDFVDFCELSPELSRDFRGLRAWLPLRLYGIDAFRAALDEKLDLARWATDVLRDDLGMEILADPQLSLSAFRLAPAGRSPEELNELNRTLLARVNARKNVFLTGTVLAGRFALRICVLSFRTHRDRMEQCLDDIRESAGELFAELGDRTVRR
ncbi:MAG: aminotransferase class I/II-fold pyridoxal phosphate-dependent enzyme [Gemmatimonadetes bacterium]|nr:aminotransferase class I/II-fold pyridoxal phosphate-dependent enzyme [Gemmatimonadota bacterium]